MKWSCRVKRCNNCGIFQQCESVKGLYFSRNKNRRTYYISNVGKILPKVPLSRETFAFCGRIYKTRE